MITEGPDYLLRQKLEVLAEIRDRTLELGLATSEVWLRESSARVALPATSVISAMRRANLRRPDFDSVFPSVREAIESAGSAGRLLAASEVEMAGWREGDFRYFERLVQIHQELVACLTSLELELKRRVSLAHGR